MYKFNSYISLLFFLLVFISSCDSSRKEDVYILKPSDEFLDFNLNPQTSIFIKSLFTYIDENGKEYLTFQNNMEPEILLYDIDSQEYIKTIFLQKEGPNGVGVFGGFYIRNLDEIYIPDMMKNEVKVVNSNGEIVKKIPYSETSEKKSTIPFVCLSFPYTPMHIINQRIYIPQSPNLRLGNSAMEESPVTIVLDTLTNILDEFPLRFPNIVTSAEIKGSSLGIEASYSQEFNGENFVYSFFFDENVYVVSMKGETRHKVEVKSKYIDKLNKTYQSPTDLNMLAKTICEVPFYGNLIYDKYRKVYYRFVYPETKLSNNENYMDIWQLGRTKFSIIILNEKMEILGETLFPENTYASNLFFIHKDGLYLSTSFVKNPNYSDDNLCFQRIDLVKK